MLKEIFMSKHPVPAPVLRMVVGDARSEIVRCYINANEGGVDLSGLYWSVHFKNARHGEDITYIGKAEDDDDGSLYIDWAVPPLACAVPGDTHFEVTGTANIDGVDVAWTSGMRVIKVFPGLMDIPPEEREELMVLHQMVIDLKQRIDELSARLDGVDA